MTRKEGEGAASPCTGCTRRHAAGVKRSPEKKGHRAWHENLHSSSQAFDFMEHHAQYLQLAQPLDPETALRPFGDFLYKASQPRTKAHTPPRPPGPL